MDLWSHPYLLADCKEGIDIADRLSSETKHSSDGSVPYTFIESFTHSLFC